jgi:hypothetical protein
MTEDGQSIVKSSVAMASRVSLPFPVNKMRRRKGMEPWKLQPFVGCGSLFQFQPPAVELRIV